MLHRDDRSNSGQEFGKERPRVGMKRFAGVGGAVILAAASLLMATGHAAAEEGGPFKIVVSADNSVSQLSRAEISRMFLGASTRWENGMRISPVDLVPDSPTRQAFSKKIHGRSVKAVRSYWRQRLFRGRASPPVELASGKEVIAYVERNRGAIGYVPAGTSIQGRKVKFLEVK